MKKWEVCQKREERRKLQFMEAILSFESVLWVRLIKINQMWLSGVSQRAPLSHMSLRSSLLSPQRCVTRYD